MSSGRTFSHRSVVWSAAKGGRTYASLRTPACSPMRPTSTFTTSAISPRARLGRTCFSLSSERTFSHRSFGWSAARGDYTSLRTPVCSPMRPTSTFTTSAISPSAQLGRTCFSLSSQRTSPRLSVTDCRLECREELYFVADAGLLADAAHQHVHHIAISPRARLGRTCFSLSRRAHFAQTFSHRSVVWSAARGDYTSLRTPVCSPMRPTSTFTTSAISPSARRACCGAAHLVNRYQLCINL